MSKKKIAILGGGIAALASAYELTSYPNWQDEYEVTVYQLGWRLGGKMSGGRGPNGRVQELGLHLLLGFYVNAFPMFEAVYKERTARGLAPDSPYKTLQDAILPNNGTLLVNFDDKEGRWINWPLIFPPTEGYPGDGAPLNTWQLLKKGVAILLETVLGSPYAAHLNPLAKWLLDHFFPADGGSNVPPALPSAPPAGLMGMAQELVEGAEAWLSKTLSGLERTVDARALEALKEGEGHPLHAVKYLEWFHKALSDEAEGAINTRTPLGRLLLLFDFGLAMIKGILTDVYNPVTGMFEYRRINDQDFRAWLKHHGASDVTLYSPMVTFFYTGTFEALDDNRQKGGLLAAGTALQFAIPALGYKGSFCYQLRLGTPDTLVMPMYEVLAARGVSFKFFHKVTNIAYTSTHRIERIEMERQVDLVVPEYDPRIHVKGNPAWPSEPLYEQIDPAQAEALKARNIDLESPWSDWKGTPLTLTLGEDFDQVILGIPSKALAQCCPEILANRPDWKAMVDNIGTAQVMSAQLWFDRTLPELGYDHAEWGMGAKNCAANVVTYANPLFSWLDQTQIIENEDWPEGKAPKTLAMFTGILPDELDVPPFSDPTYPATQVRRVRDLTWQWLMDNMGFFLPAARTRAYPNGLDLSTLRGNSPDETDPRRKYMDQYFAAAISPTNQYVIALPGTERYRLRPDGSGFDNMVLVGDWTDYGVNIGYMEGCVVSAHQAVRALRGSMGKRDFRPYHVDTLADWSVNTRAAEPEGVR